jgi:Na+/proline symporter
MWSISITDTIQTILIIGGLLYLSYYFYNQSGGLNVIKATIPDDFFRIVPKESNVNSWLLYFSAWITIGWGSIPQQDVFQRVLSAKSENTAVKGSIISAFMYLTVAFLPLSVVLFGSISHPELLKADNQMFIPELVLAHSNLFVQILFFGALISAILSTCSAAILAPATVVAENIIRPYFGQSLTDKDLLKIMRYSTIVITIIAISMTFIKTNIYELVGEASALSLVALFVPLSAGLYWKKANKTGATLSMVFGTISWLIALNINLGVPPAVFGFVISFLAMFFGSLFSKA